MSAQHELTSKNCNAASWMAGVASWLGRSVRILVLGFVGVMVAGLFEWPQLELPSENHTAPPEIHLTPQPPTQQAPSREDLAKPHLDRALKETERIIDEHLRVLDAFFVDSKKNTGVFAEEALSFRSKMLLASDAITKAAQAYNAASDNWCFRALAGTPWLLDMAAKEAATLRDDRHSVFIREKFEEYVLKRTQLEEEVSQVIKSYLASVRSIEGKMLVDLRADVADFPPTSILAQMNEKHVQSAYDDALTQATEATASSLHADVATELVASIVAEVCTRVAVRLGISAGILGSGAASGWSTFGVGVVVALIVDQFVQWLWDWWADPRGNLAADLDRQLDEIHALIVDGLKDVRGLRAQLHQFASERAGVRRQAVLDLLQPQTGGQK